MGRGKGGGGVGGEMGLKILSPLKLVLNETDTVLSFSEKFHLFAGKVKKGGLPFVLS